MKINLRSLLCFAIVAVYALVFFWLAGITSDSDAIVRAFDTDEAGVLVEIYNMYVERTFEPMVYVYGSAHTYLSLLGVYFVGLFKDIVFQDVSFIARGVNFLSLIAVGWLFLRFSLVSESRKWSFLLFLLIICSGVNFQYTLNAKPELLQLFFLTCSLFIFQSFFAHRSALKLFWSGFFAGLAFATKYIGLLLILFQLAVLVFAFLGPRSNRGNVGKLIKNAMLLAVGVFFGCLVLGPFLMIEYDTVFEVFKAISDWTTIGWLFKSNRPWYDWLGVLFEKNVLWWGLALWVAPCGLIIVAKFKDFSLPPLYRFIGLFWALGYLLYVFATAKVMVPRYLIVVLPFLLECLCWLFFEIEKWLGFRNRTLLYRTMTVCFFLLAAYSLTDSTMNTIKRIQERPQAMRVVAGEWLANNVRPYKIIASDYYTYVPNVFFQHHRRSALSAYDVISISPDYIVTSQEIMSRYLNAEKEKDYYSGTEGYMRHYYLYANLKNDKFPGYSLLKDFGEVKVFRKTSS